VSVASASLAAARGAGRTLDRLVERPRLVLGTLVAAQLCLTLVFAASVAHNGWVYFQGGDQIVNTTTAWLLGQLQLPPTEVGYLWPLVVAPVTWVSGPTFVQALPPLVLLNVVVLGPVALLSVYALGSSIGGRLLGYWASFLWVVAPFAAIPLFVDRYHDKWIEQFLPQGLGLTATSDYASMVLVLVAAVFVVRSLEPGRLWEGALAGLAFGAAVGLKPSNVLFAGGAALALLVARRWRDGAAFAVAATPALLVLAFWKYRGLGELPLFAYQRIPLAAGTTPLAIDASRYVKLDFHHWRQQMDALREFFWSARLAQWTPFAGMLAVARVRRPVAALLAGWLGAYLLVKGFSPRASIESGTFWRLLMPAWPAYLLLFASIPLLVPTLVRRLGDRVDPPPWRAVRPRWVAVATVVTVVVPAVATAASSRIEPPTPTVVQEFPSGNILTPVDSSIHVRVERAATGERISWTTRSWHARVFYKVYRSVEPGRDVQCVLSSSSSWSCYLRTSPVYTTTNGSSYVDRSGRPGFLYRVGVGTNWLDDPSLGDVFALSPAVRAPDR
jgi:hypothetical protein